MNNIQKSFKKKSELRCMADGGEAPDGGVKGPGGPTDDKVGPVMLSDGEYVLPADTVKAIGKDKLDAIREATHKFVESEPGGLANGGAPFYVDPDGVATRGAQPGRALVPMRQPGASTAMTVPESLRAPSASPGAAAASAVRPEIMGAEGRASARASAFNAAGNPYGASRVAPAAAGAASVAPAAEPGRLARAAGVGGSILRGLGRLAGGAGGVYGLATGGADIAKNGANVTNVGDTVAGGAGLTAALASGAVAPVAGAAATGWGVGRMIGGNLSADTNNAIGGTVNEIGLMAKKHLGFGWGDENAYVPAADASPLRTPTPPTNLTPVADATRGTGSPMANEKPPSGPQYYADLERQHQQELKALAGGNREAGARAAAGGGPGAGKYQGLVENRSGLPNSAISGADPNSYYASRADGDIVGSFNGRNITKKEADARAGGLATASGQAMKPEGDPAMAEIRSALRGIGNGGGGGNWAPRSQADEINERYDSLMRGGSGRNIVKGSDWSQRHGVDVEMARARELGADATNQSQLRGQTLQAGASADQTRMSGITKMMELQAEREKAGAMGQAAATKAQQDAIANAAKANQQGYENFTKATASMFPDADPVAAATKQQEFVDFVSATDEVYLKENAGVSSVKDLFDLPPQEQMNAVQRLKTMMEMQQAANKSIGSGTFFNNGPQQTGYDAPVGEPTDASWDDVVNNNLSVGQYLYSNIPGLTDNRVQRLASGSVVPYDELVGNKADRELARKRTLLGNQQ